MIKVKTTLVLLICIIWATVDAHAQECSFYYPFQEGAEFELSHYDKKGKTASKAIYKIQDVSASGGVETATMNMEIFDEKGESIVSSEYHVTCQDDVVSIDFSNLISPNLFETYKDMEFEMSGENLQLPNNLSVGQSLPDAYVVMDVQISPVTMKIRTDVTNRQVVAKESVTTQAGTFDCYLITYDTVLKSGMGIKQKASAKQWITKKLGIVKQENYNGRGKMIGHTELTAFRGITQ